MLGYIEPPYTVEKRHEAKRTTHREVGELRIPINGPRDRYIALALYSLGGKLIAAHLLIYKGDAASEHLERDWTRLTTEPGLKFEQLNFSAQIEDRHIGFGRDGSVTMD
jgi:hypothetical protein